MTICLSGSPVGVGWLLMGSMLLTGWHGLLAQTPRLMTSARAVQLHTTGRSTADSAPASASASALLPADTAPAVGDPFGAMPLHLRPLFGEQAKTPEQIDFEVHFLMDCDQSFGSRAEASQFFAARGWDYLSESQLDTAVYRFNMAWLLNERNVDAYWGLGVISYQRDQLPDAIRLLRRGVAVSDTNAVLLSDLATLELQHFRTAHNPADLTQAESHLQRAVALKPDHATAFQKLSLVHYQKGDYELAWTCLHKARTLDLSTLDFSYLNDLMAKMPDPQGVFK